MDILGFSPAVKHLNLVDLAEAMAALCDSVKEEQRSTKERLMRLSYEKMKV